MLLLLFLHVNIYYFKNYNEQTREMAQPLRILAAPTEDYVGS